VQKLSELSMNRGEMGPRLVLVSTLGYANLNDSLIGLARLSSPGGNSSQVTLGADDIVYRGASGKLTIVPHPMVKLGHMIVVPENRLHRVGSTDLTFNMPGVADGMSDSMVLQLATQSGLEMRAFTDQAIVCDRPAEMAIATGLAPA
jgi:hypothetical protein